MFASLTAQPNFEHARIPHIDKWFACKPPLYRVVEFSAFKKCGEVIVAFKPEATKSDIEQLLGLYSHKKVLDLKLDPAAARSEQVLALTYLLKVPAGKETIVVEELKTKYNALVEHAYRPSMQNFLFLPHNFLNFLCHKLLPFLHHFCSGMRFPRQNSSNII